MYTILYQVYTKFFLWNYDIRKNINYPQVIFSIISLKPIDIVLVSGVEVEFIWGIINLLVKMLPGNFISVRFLTEIIYLKKQH